MTRDNPTWEDFEELLAEPVDPNVLMEATPDGFVFRQRVSVDLDQCHGVEGEIADS